MQLTRIVLTPVAAWIVTAGTSGPLTGPLMPPGAGGCSPWPRPARRDRTAIKLRPRLRRCFRQVGRRGQRAESCPPGRTASCGARGTCGLRRWACRTAPGRPMHPCRRRRSARHYARRTDGGNKGGWHGAFVRGPENVRSAAPIESRGLLENVLSKEMPQNLLPDWWEYLSPADDANNLHPCRDCRIGGNGETRTQASASHLFGPGARATDV
jgi:hypothetical protein